MDNDTDQRLVDRIAQGDRQALSALYDRYAAEMLGLARVLLRSQGWAEDLLHDVFIEVWQRAAAYDSTRGNVRGWLFVRLRSRALDRLRMLKRAADHGMAVVDDARRHDAQETTSDLASIQSVFSRLSDAQQDIVMRAYFRGQTQAEIAHDLDIPLGTVKSRAASALARLRELLEIDR